MGAASTATTESALRTSKSALLIAKQPRDHRSAQSRPHNALSYGILATTAVCCIFQLLWFYRACIHNIDFDGLDYLGIARHILDSHFTGSINAFRSPLISWLIALIRPHPEQFVIAGKVVTFSSYLATIVLLYVFTLRLWNSRLAAATAVLLYVLARGIFANSLLLVSPDYLFTALTVVYFLALDKSLRTTPDQNWFYLGCVHGLAYLAKAFALPWFAVTTGLAILLSAAPRKQKVRRLGLAAIAPVIIAGLWASALYMKYSVFTTGSQFKTNLLQWTLHYDLSPHHQDYEVLTDTSQSTDAYIVTDPMPPHSPAWSFHPRLRDLLPPIIRAEVRNLPRALKEIVIVVTPGGCLLFCFSLFAFGSTRKSHQQVLIISLTAVSSLTLVLAYCMMVFDERYILPIVPLVIAVAAGEVFQDQSAIGRPVRFLCAACVVGGLAFTLTYSSSPFRTLRRDFEASCADAGSKLRSHPNARVVTLGVGPFPERGVGWEAGYKAAFFGRARIVATASSVPGSLINPLQRDISKVGTNAVLLWGAGATYNQLINDLATGHPGARSEPIIDPERGQVGTIVFMK